MENRDLKKDRAEYLFEQVKPELIKILRNAPEYGLVGLDVTLHQGEILRLLTKTEISRKLAPRVGGAG